MQNVKAFTGATWWVDDLIGFVATNQQGLKFNTGLFKG
jgi:hypothetical protein